MSETAIRAQIQSNLEGVTGIGVVYDRERFTRSPGQFFRTMEHEGSVNGWMIHRESAEATREVGGRITRNHVYRIFGIYSINDEEDSETDFQALLENIYSAFIDDRTLNDTCANTSPINIESILTEEYKGTLFHVAELVIEAEERITP